MANLPTDELSATWPFQISEEVEKLKALKLEMGDAPSPGGKLILKTAKGTRDYEPRMMAVREKVLEKVMLQNVDKEDSESQMEVKC